MIRGLSLGILVLLAGCNGQEGVDDAQGALETVVISTDSSVFEPTRGIWPLQPELIAGAVSSGLVRLDGNGQVVPDLATSWRVSDDGLSVIFRLRRAEWSDGRRVTGDDFVRMFRGILAPGSNHPFKPLLETIENGEAVARGRKPPGALGVSSPIPDVVEVRLSAPMPSLLQLFANPAMGIADRNMSNVALGPFRVARKETGLVVLTPNPRYGDPGAVQVGEIRLHAESEAAVALQRFKRERAGLLLGGTTGDFVLARGAALDRFLRLDPVRGIYGYRPVKFDGPLGDARIRQALAMVLNRDTIAAATGAGTASPVTGVLAWSLAELPQPQQPEWASASLSSRIDAARLLIRSARGNTQTAPLTLRVALPHGPGHAAILQQAAQYWAELGVKVEAVAADAADADLAVMETLAPADNADWFFHQYRCRPKAYCNPQVDRLLDQAGRAKDRHERRRLLAEAERLLVTDQPIIPLMTPIRWSMVDPAVLGWSDNALAQHPLASLGVVASQGAAGGAAR